MGLDIVDPLRRLELLPDRRSVKTEKGGEFRLVHRVSQLPPGALLALVPLMQLVNLTRTGRTFLNTRDELVGSVEKEDIGNLLAPPSAASCTARSPRPR